MTPSISLAPPRTVRRALTDGLLASSVSAAALLWRGRTDASSAVAPLNAVSHWFWPEAALRSDRPSLKYTATGTAVHYASSMVWAGLYGWLRERRRRPTTLNAVSDAALVSTLAAVVDLKLVPKRLTPGFEERLQPASLAMVYAGFAAGLALGGLLHLRR